MEKVFKIFGHELRGIIYDCDGVMINSRAANTLFYNRVLAYFNLPPMNEEQELYTFMASGMQALLHILPEELHPQISYVATEVINYDRDIVPLLKLMPDFREFVEEMHSQGILQAMCTNRTDQGFESVLNFFDFPRYFDPIMTVSKVKPKPSAEGACKIVQDWHLSPKNILYIGDSQHDQKAAQGAGVVFCAFNGLNLTGDLVSDSFTQLKTVLQEV